MPEKKQDNRFSSDKIAAWGKALSEWKWFIKLIVLLVLAIIYKTPILLILDELNIKEIIAIFKRNM